MRIIASRCIPWLSLAIVSLLAACGGGGGGGSTGGGGAIVGPPPPPNTPFQGVHSGLVALAAGNGEMRADWDPPEAGYESCLFHSATSTTLLTGTQVFPLTGTSAVVSGVPNGAIRYASLAIRPVGTTTWTLVGTTLRVHPGAPIYVDAAAPSAGNGSAATPYQSLQAALAAAAATTNANIWVRDGSYGPARFIVPPSTHVFGGFAAGQTFSLANRAPLANRTILTSGIGQATFDVTQVGVHVVLDGFLLDGRNQGFIGVDQDSIDLDVRAMTIRNYADRGIRLRNTSNEPSIVRVCSCVVQSNGADGLNLLGQFDIHVDGSTFDSNRQEGLECGTLTALNTQTSVLKVTDCRFYGNLAEGLDASLAQPALNNAAVGRFDVLVRGCLFEANALDGLLIDQEHELAPNLYAHVVVRECTSLNNGGCGVHIDADAAGDFLMHRIRACANQKDGVWVSSETRAGCATLSSSELRGNYGVGARASIGNVPLLLSHCVVEGNLQGSVVSTFRTSSSANTIYRLQPTPPVTVLRLGDSSITDPAAAAFVYAPTSYGSVLASSNGTLTLGQAAQVNAGNTIELAEDSVVRNVASATGSTVVLTANATLLRAPTVIAGFAGTSVTEDLHLNPQSAAVGQGMQLPGGNPVDPGIYGAPAPGAPGVADTIDAQLLSVEQVTPAPSSRLNNGNCTIQLSKALNATSGASVRAYSLSAGTPQVPTPIAPGITISGAVITLTPPAGGWGTTPIRIELHRGIVSTAGTGATAFSTPMIIPLLP